MDSYDIFNECRYHSWHLRGRRWLIWYNDLTKSHNLTVVLMAAYCRLRLISVQPHGDLFNSGRDRRSDENATERNAGPSESGRKLTVQPQTQTIMVLGRHFCFYGGSKWFRSHRAFQTRIHELAMETVLEGPPHRFSWRPITVTYREHYL